MIAWHAITNVFLLEDAWMPFSIYRNSASLPVHRRVFNCQFLVPICLPFRLVITGFCKFCPASRDFSRRLNAYVSHIPCLVRPVPTRSSWSRPARTPCCTG